LAKRGERRDVPHVDKVAILRFPQLIHTKAAVHDFANSNGDVELVGQPST
jgi:hypothetical protein